MKANDSDLVHLRWLVDSNLREFKGLRVLDLGCGSGYINMIAAKEGALESIGLDIVEPKAAEVSNLMGRSTASEWRFIKADLDSPGWQNSSGINGKFDLILAFDILEHVSSPYQFLLSCADLLSPAGKLIVTTPNLNSWERYLRPNSWSGIQDDQHKVLFTRYSLNFLSRRAGLRASKTIAPMKSLSWMSSIQPQIGGQIFCVMNRL